MAPSSGMSAHRPAAQPGPQPGTDCTISARRARPSSAARQARIRPSRSRMRAERSSSAVAPTSRAASQLTSRCSLRSASRCSTSLRRRATKSLRSRNFSGLGGTARRLSSRPKVASMRASTRSFLAKCPRASAKRRERSGLASTVSMPAATGTGGAGDGSRGGFEDGAGDAQLEQRCARRGGRTCRWRSRLWSSGSTCASSRDLPTSMPATIGVTVGVGIPAILSSCNTGLDPRFRSGHAGTAAAGQPSWETVLGT